MTRDEERQLELLLEGGRVKNSAGKWVTVRWHGKINAYDRDLKHNAERLAERTSVLEQIAKIKTRRRPAYKPDTLAVEKAGLEALKGYDTKAKKRPCALRIFYLSEGGEILCTESEPMTFEACESARSAHFLNGSGALFVKTVPSVPTSLHGVVEVEVPHEVREKLAKLEVGKRPDLSIPARERAVLAAARKQPHKCRFVLFPSQRPEKVLMDDASWYGIPDTGVL